MVLNSALAANPMWTPTVSSKHIRREFKVIDNGNNPKSINRKINCVHLHNGIKRMNSAIKKNEVLTYTVTWMNLRTIFHERPP